MKNIEAKINEKVIAGLTEKGFEWFKPWTNAAGSIERPVSWVNGRAYKGTNMFMLNFEMIACGYEHNQWLTAKQGYAAGGSNKGETGTPVIFWQQGFKVADKNGKYKFFKNFEEKKAHAFASKNGTRVEKTLTLREYTVFNIAQFKDLDAKTFGKSAPTIEEIVFEPSEVADSIMDNWSDKPVIKHLTQQAYYSPTGDFINMPKQETFVDSDSYYKVLFHEGIHATGHKSRLNRFKGDAANAAFGSKEYSKEELTAEIGAMYLVGLCNLNPKDSDDNSLAYIRGWVKHLTDHPKECITAMQRASKAVIHITGGDQ
jgi:antirestriction protein ArdC